jgi:hypothetical protein
MLEQLKNEGFAHINPPVPVWIPSDGDTIRGYILARQIDRHDDPFYVLQLTKPWGDGDAEIAAGTRVAVYETSSLSACRKLMPHYQDVQQAGVTLSLAVFAYEVQFVAGINPEQASDEIGIEIYARRVNGQGAQPPIGPVPAPFTLPVIARAAITTHQATLEEQPPPVPEATGAEEAQPNGAG